MEKIITISVAAYNVEKYISRTIDSIINSKYINSIELILVNDGSTDSTLEILSKYEDKFSESIVVIDKNNAGYGSVHNYSISIAKGTYFKILDGDDWFDTIELDIFIEKLFKIDVDLVISDFTRVFEGSNILKKQSFNYLKEGIIYKMNEYNHNYVHGMWSLCYKSQLLKDSGLNLPEKKPYTDQIYCVVPMNFVRYYAYISNNLYQYRIGSDGQSVSKESRIKNINHTIDIFNILLSFNFNNNINYINKRLASYYLFCLRTILLLPINKENLNMLKLMESKIKNSNIDIYNLVVNIGKFGKLIKYMRFSNYRIYWLLKPVSKKIPNWV